MKKKIFVIHGWTYSLEKWQPIQSLLASKGIELVLLKVPGLTEPSARVWDMDGYVAWLHEKIKTHEYPVVIGHSNGGRIALNYLTKYPGTFSELILIDSAGVPHQQPLARLKLGVLRALSKLGKPIAKIPTLKRIVYRVIGAQDYHQAPSNMKKTMQNMLKANTTIAFDKIDVPTTLIWGMADQQTPIGDANFLAKTIPGAKLHIIQNARHAPMFTHPGAVAAIIEEVVH